MAIAIELRGRRAADWAGKVAEGSRDLFAHAVNPRYLAGRLAWLVLLTGLVVEGLLAFRLWVQITNQSLTSSAMSLLFEASTFLISPFASMETTQPIKDTGVLEFATLVALEAYLAATLIGLLALFLAPKLARLAIAAGNAAARATD
jgi:hypothetical protein